MILVSIDDHVVEPPNVFDDHLPAKWQDVAPKCVRTKSGADVWMFNGAAVPNLAINAVSGLFPEEYGLEPTSYEQIRPGTYDIHERIRDMNANGVLGSLNFPSFPSFSGRLFMGLEDKAAAYAIVQAYNDWHVDEWCGTYPGRMIPCIITPIWDPELMAAEVRRNAAKGVHAVTFTENPAKLDLPSFHSDHWDPFFAACAETDTNICLHIGSSSQLAITSADAPVDVMILLQAVNLIQARGRPAVLPRAGGPSPTCSSRSARAGSAGCRTSTSGPTTATGCTTRGRTPTSAAASRATCSASTSRCASSRIRTA